MAGLHIYRSSAGSGKTYTLVKEYLRIVLNKPGDLPRTLAITFTNKATDEMKSRIISALVELKNGENSSLENDLASLLPNVDIPHRATLVLSKILHDYSGFAVTTIDSFFYRILKAFPRELNISTRFDLELDSKHVASLAVKEMMEKVGTDEELTKWLVEYLISKLDEDKSRQLSGDLQEFAAELFKDHVLDPELLPGRESIRTFKEEIHNQIYPLRKIIRTKATEILELLEKGNISIDDIAFGKGGIGYAFLKLADGMYPENVMEGQRIRNCGGSAEVWFSKSNRDRDRMIAYVDAHILHKANDIIQYFFENELNYNTAIQAAKLIYLTGLLSDIHTEVKEYCKVNRKVMISDTGRILSKAIANDDAPFIYEKTGNRYKHFLIDEFQDTSSMQWNNMVPLLTNALSQGNFVMVVGDIKQSIYRWRGGNMELLQNTVNDTIGTIIKPEEIYLDKNFRSKDEVIGFNNQLFSILSTLNGGNSITGIIPTAYGEEQVSQKPGKVQEGKGYIQIEFEPEDDEVEDELEEIGGLDSQWALERTWGTIQELLETGYDKSDIALLYRKNDQGSKIASFLFSKGFRDIVSVESLKMGSSLTVNYLVDLLRFLEDPTDRIIIASLYQGIKKFEEQIEITENKYMEDPISFIEKLGFFDRRRKLGNGFYEGSLLELTNNVIRVFGMQKHADTYVQKFLDLVLEYERDNGSSLPAFIEYWMEDGVNSSLSISDSTDAIKLMTVHKAKGLQFPVVIMPYANWSMAPMPNSHFWVKGKSPFDKAGTFALPVSSRLKNSLYEPEYVHEDEMVKIDSINMLYVAFTRPEDRLYVFSGKKPKKVTDEPKKINALLYSILESKKMNGDWDPESGIYMEGEKSLPTKRKIKELKSKELTEFILTSKRAEWKARGVNHVLMNLMETKPEDPRLFGMAIHEVLSKLVKYDDLIHLIDKMTLNGEIPSDMKDEIIIQVKNILEIPQVKDWFEPGVINKAEADILLPGNGMIRPDKVIFNKNEVIIADFKSGMPDKAHEVQMNQYKEQLELMGYENVKCCLLYTSLKRIDWLN